MSTLSMDDLVKVIKDLEDSEPIVDMPLLDVFVEQGGDISNSVLMVHHSYEVPRSVKTKYGRIEIMRSPIVPIERIFIMPNPYAPYNIKPLS